MHSPGLRACIFAAVCVCVLEGLVAPEEAVCHKASLALTRGPTARAGGMKLKLTTQEKKGRGKVRGRRRRRRGGWWRRNKG